MPARDRGPKTGPRGGTTTVSASGMVRSTVFLDEAEHEFLRQKAFADRSTISELVRNALHVAYPELDEIEGPSHTLKK